MHGAGTKRVTTLSKPSNRLLDLSRLVSRVGRGPMTGVDRVEMAYLHALLRDPVPLYSLIGLSGGFSLLDEVGTQALFHRMVGKDPWGKPDLKSIVRLKQSPAQRSAQSDCRRLAISNSFDLRKLALRIPKGVSYLNVGHSNVNLETFKAIRSIGGSINVLVHDTIPLDFPEFQRPGTAEKFSTKMKAVSEFADLVIYNSHQSRADGMRHFSKFGRVPNDVVAHLGLAKPSPGADVIRISGFDPNQPYFVTVGTIEPRKNHSLLLDIWEGLAQSTDAPQLVIVGSRGWENQAVFDRLNKKPAQVFEVGGLSDRKVARLVLDSAGLLFPSVAEGFGLPPAEAILQQTPVICGDLPVYREFLGDIPIYVDTADRYSWEREILKLVHRKQEKKAIKFDLNNLPTWSAHFNKVLRVA